MQRLQTQKLQILRAQNARLELLRRRLDALKQNRALNDPGAFIQDKQMLFAHLQKDLYHAGAASLRTPGNKLASLAASLDAMSPLKVLGRGFSLLENEAGEVNRSCADVTIGEKITATLADGKMTCTVDECEKSKKRG